MRRRKWSEASVAALDGALEALHELLRLYAGAREQVVFNHPARADVEALRLIEIATVHVDAMAQLARVDIPPSLLPAASASRSAYEAAYLSAWLLGPVDPVERDQRWLGYLAAHVRFYKNLAAEFKNRDEEIHQSMTKVQDYWEKVGSEFGEGLPDGHKEPIAYSGINGSLPEKKKQYYMYRAVSQLVHAEPTAISFAPLELRLADKPKQESLDYSLHSEPAQWGYVIGMAGEAVIWPLEVAIERLSDFARDFAAEDWKVFLGAIDQLINSA